VGGCSGLLDCVYCVLDRQFLERWRERGETTQIVSKPQLLNKVSRLSKIPSGQARLLVKNGASGEATRLLIRAQIRRNYGDRVLRLVQVQTGSNPTIFSDQVGVCTSLVAFIRFISSIFSTWKFGGKTE
jgi:hypothetical protein